ncbi:MAG: alpha/beta hydrolase [Caldilineaceae bacterium]
MAWFKTDTGRIHSEIRGRQDPSAPSLTLLHNFMSNGKTAWGSMVDDFAADYRILMPDSPGHGRSQGYPADFDHREMARQIAALMAAEDALNGHLAGVSSGGMIAQQLVHLGLVAPSTLTLVSTTYSNDSRVTGVERRLKPEDFKANGRWLEATARLHDPHHHEGYFDDVLLPAFRKLTPAQTIDLTLDDLRSWTMPVCIIHGSEDEFFPEKIVADMASAIPHAERHMIEGQPHALIFRRPWAVAEIMRNFLSRHPVTAESKRQ